MEKMRPIVHQTLSAKVYQDLRELIISGQLQPGERWQSAQPGRAMRFTAIEQRFDQIDTNQDQFVSREEFETAMKSWPEPLTG